MNPIRFDYVNHRGEDHNYVMTPEPRLTYEAAGAAEPLGWKISGHVISRDGVNRPGRRTFMLTGMRNIEAVNKETP